MVSTIVQIITEKPTRPIYETISTISITPTGSSVVSTNVDFEFGTNWRTILPVEVAHDLRGVTGRQYCQLEWRTIDVTSRPRDFQQIRTWTEDVMHRLIAWLIVLTA